MMIKRRPDKFWFPFWPDKWIWGTIRIECTPAERGIWVDLLALASKDDGHIRANEELAYPIQQLAGTLIIPEEDLKNAINKFIKMGKLTKTKAGTLYVAKWEKYQFSDRHRRRIEEEMSGKKDVTSKKKDEYNISNNNISNNNKEEEQRVNINAEQEMQIYKELIAVKNIGKNKASQVIRYIRELSIEFPDLDYVEEIKKKCTWWRDNLLNKSSNIHLQLRNWFKISQKGFTEAKRAQRVGKDAGGHRSKYPMLFLNSVYSLLTKQSKNNAEYSDKLFALSDEEAKELAEKYKDSPDMFIKFLEEKK